MQNSDFESRFSDALTTRIPNYLDDDSDGDSIPDAVEGSDDQDGDGFANYVDLDRCMQLNS